MEKNNLFFRGFSVYHRVMIRVSLQSMKEAEKLLVGLLVIMNGLKKRKL